jgi:putative CocE/NonD family hydrolase
MNKSVLLVWMCIAFCLSMPAQRPEFPGPPADDEFALSKYMSNLAKQVASVYHDDDRRTYLDNLFRAQIVAGQYTAAAKSLQDLRAFRTAESSPQARATNVQYEIYVHAKVTQVADGSLFADSFGNAFRETLATLDDLTSAMVMREFNAGRFPFGISLHVPMEEDLRDALSRQRGRGDISLADALILIHTFQVEETYRAMAPLTASLIAEDDERRYIINANVRVATPDGATVCALIVRPQHILARRPALLEFTIYADPTMNMSEARRTASNGYVGVEGLTRGKGCSPDSPVPYEYDGADAAILIDWISKQEWSDGRVGMFGGSYNGFTQWAAVKHTPRALKAIMPSVTNAPGIDAPMEGNIFENFQYSWPFYTTVGKEVDAASYSNQERWTGLNRNWYTSGGPYRSMDKLDGTPNPFFDRWVGHPDYDIYWQSMIPYKDEFARIDIPVLTTTGYYDGGQIGALYYLTEHYRYNLRAEHYLLIGPYDHGQGQRGTFSVLGDSLNVLRGYEIDPMAQIDIGEIRYEWFNFIFKGGPKPTILRDKINYEVMGANVWKHAPSLSAMADSARRFYFADAQSGDAYRLMGRQPNSDSAISQTIDFTDRTDVNRLTHSNGIVDKHLDTWNGVEFVSDPFAKATEVSGLFSAHLDLIVNKKDIDFNLQLYELTPNGDYFQLSYYAARASYVTDRSHRHLLQPNEHVQLDFTSGRLTSRQFRVGSRLVIVLSIIKQPGLQINYGTGGDVSDESIADAEVPLRVKWCSGSYVSIPISEKVSMSGH